MQLEICCGDLSSVIAAKEGGADRIELCSGLSEGGLTPSIGLIRAAVRAGFSQINVLIRPRPGDFLYSEPELELMQHDIAEAIEAGANGIVVGVITPDGEIDKASTARLIETARAKASEKGIKLNITFHRAFDVSSNPAQSLEDVISLGCDTLLTSGMAPSAVRGILQLQQLANQARGRITIMAGAGINPYNAADIIKATGVDAIHSTARKPTPSLMRFRRPLVAMGVPGSNEYAPLSTSPDIVGQLVDICAK